MTASFLRFAAIVALAVLLCGGRSPESGPRAQASYGSLEVGKQIPGFGSVSDTGEHYQSREPWTNLTIYSIAPEHPPCTVDVGEKVPSPRARKMGARLMRTGDPKVAKLFGMKVVHGKPFRYDTTMVVICDEKCRVLRIWTSAGIDDLDNLLKQFESERAGK